MMRTLTPSVIAAALTFIAAPALDAQDTARVIAGGGVHVPGWAGKIDAREAAAGQKLENAKITKEGDVLKVATGPAVAYWHGDNKATGDYTVKATFTEAEYMNRNNHPHPYGIFIGGSDMGTDAQRYLYCAAYGSGTFIVRGFGPEPFQLNGRRGEAHDAVHKAAGQGQPVTQEIALSVHGDKVECAINGTTVASYSKADVVGEGKLTSTDGVYGVRFGHNTEATVTGLGMAKH
jgi:hypothetical protein